MPRGPIGDVPPPAEVAAEPPPAPLAPAAPPAKPFAERLLDPEGPVPGMPGFSITRKPSKQHCTGIEIVTKRSKKVSKDDAPLAEVYALEFPKGLSFDPNDATKREASMKKFSDWLENMRRVAENAQQHYEKALDAKQDPAAVARIAQIVARLSSLIARAEIPADVRTGEYAAEKILAYCDAMQQAAEPLLAKAEDAIAVCATQASGQPAGWWTPVCTSPAP